MFVFWIKECIFSASKEGLVAVHARAIDTKHRLRHKCSIDTILLGNFFDDVFTGSQIICGGLGIAVLLGVLVLAWGFFVVRFLPCYSPFFLLTAGFFS